jgi:hypothetical protein
MIFRNMNVEVNVVSIVNGLMNSSGLSIVLRKMLHIALFATCSKIATNLLVEIRL